MIQRMLAISIRFIFLPTTYLLVFWFAPQVWPGRDGTAATGRASLTCRDSEMTAKMTPHTTDNPRLMAASEERLKRRSAVKTRQRAASLRVSSITGWREERKTA